MLKRKAAGRFRRHIKRKIKGKYKRSKLISKSTPVNRKRTQESTPPSTGRRLFHTAKDVVSRGASFVSPAAGFGFDVAMDLGETLYDRFTHTGSKKNYGGNAAAVGGKVAPRKKFYKKKRSKNPSIATIQKKGITLNFEHRKIATASNCEAMAIGHTSMPGKTCAINLWRAIIKYLMVKAGIIIKDYGNLMTGEGFIVGDIIRVNRYISGTANTTSSNDFPVSAAYTYDQLAADMNNMFDDTDTLSDDRLESIEIITTGSSHVPRCNLELNTLKITVYTRSELKVQNVTVETTADNEADDVTRVPLIGKIYGLRGNNMMRKSNSALLSGFFHLYNEECLFGAYTRQDSATIGNNAVYFYNAATGPSNNDQTTFSKPSEPPRVYELSNCHSVGNITLAPGESKTSVLTQKYTFGLQYYFNMIYASRNTNTALLVYNPKQGKANVIYVEKNVGRAPTADNAIKCWVELQFRQTVMVHGGGGTMTLPIQYQADFT